MLLRIAARYGVRVQSLQHVLEGYKVAAEIAAHGASASTFSDWWAYKIEAFDAIPFNAALLTQAGVNGLHQERRRGADPAPLPRSRQDGQVRQRPRGPGPGHDHHQPGPRAGPRPPPRLDRGRQGRRHRPVQRPPLRRLRPLRADPDRRRGLVPAQGRRTASSPPAPGDHAAMPARRAAEAKAAVARPRRRPAGRLRHHRRDAPPGLRARHPDGTLIVAGGKIAAIGGPDTPIPPGAASIDAKGLDVWPGLIDAGSPSACSRSAASRRRRTPPTPPSSSPSCGPAPRCTPTAN